jgi:hypothetical protein
MVSSMSLIPFFVSTEAGGSSKLGFEIAYSVVRGILSFGECDFVAIFVPRILITAFGLLRLL